MAFQESPVGSVVFQALAVDPDDPATPNGRLTYKFLDDGTLGTDHASFEIRKCCYCNVHALLNLNLLLSCSFYLHTQTQLPAW